MIDLTDHGAASMPVKHRIDPHRSMASDGGGHLVKSQGRLELSIRARGTRAFVAREHQSGCLRSRVLGRAGCETLTIATINTAGGLTGGDHLVQRLRWGRDAQATVTTTAAEKIYRSAGGRARVDVHLKVDAGGGAEWLPQETILFDGARLERSLEIELADDAALVACDAIVFGRLARGERLNAGSFSDMLKVYRNGRLILFDQTAVAGSISDWLDGLSTARAHRACGVVLVASNEPEQVLSDIRGALENAAGLTGATLVRGLVHVRLLSRCDAELRSDMARALSAARRGRPLPRNWSC